MLGRKILHYKIIEKLGEGGMGVVYKAEDLKLKRNVAIKFLPSYIAQNEEDRSRFRLEAQAAASLNHPNITQIYSIEELDGEIFIVMEFIEGNELKSKTDSPYNIEQTIKIAINICSGLSAAHNKGIIHRDIKSGNIMCSEDGKVKIMDFGLAKVQGNADITRKGTTLGTTSYMSPEHFRGGEVDQRSDIWALGILLYEMLTGKMPFSGAYEQAVIYSILNEEPEAIIGLNEAVPLELKEIVDKCLKKNPDERYETAEELREDLENLFSGKTAGKNVKQKIDLYQKLHSGFKSKISYGIGAAFSIMLLTYFFILPKSNFISDYLFEKAALEKQSLLILPFTNIGSDPKNQAYCDGLLETLTSKLTEIESIHSSLMVVPSSEVRRYAVASPGEAQKSFGVNLAVTGSLQLFDNITRLTLNLVDTKSMRQINSSVIDVNASDFIALQDNSVLNLLKMLELEINKEAEDLIKEGSTEKPGAYDFYLQGLGYLQRYEKEENLDFAEELFYSAIEEDSLYALAYGALGETYWRKYELLKDVTYISLAELLCKKAFNIDPNLAQANRTLGMIGIGTGEFVSAIQYFEKAIEIEPKNAYSYGGLAKAYESMNLLDQAEETYKRAIKLKPGYWAGYNDLGVFYFSHNQLQKAIKEFTRVTILTPDNYKGYNNLGGVYYRQEEWLKAREMFEKSFAINRSYSVASNLGTLYYLEGNFEEAINKYNLAIELNDRDYTMWGNLGSALYWSNSERGAAEKAFKRAIRLAEKKIEINPDDPEVLSHLGGYYSMLGEKDLTIRYLKKAIKLAPDNSEVMYLSAASYERIGNREEAVKWLKRSIDNGYSRAEIFLQPEFQALLGDKRFQTTFSIN